jgi:hypothetical protein
MVRLNVDIIIVVTTPAALAVKNATTTIPIVHPNAINPLSTGLIASLAHPGGNLTGGAQMTAEVSAKRLQQFSVFVCQIRFCRPSRFDPGDAHLLKQRQIGQSHSYCHRSAPTLRIGSNTRKIDPWG